MGIHLFCPAEQSYLITRKCILMYNLNASFLLSSNFIRAAWTSISNSTHTSLFAHWYLLTSCSHTLTCEKWGHLGRRGASGEKGSRAAEILCTWCTWCNGNHVSTPGRSPFLGQVTHTGFPLDTGLPSTGDEHLAARCWYAHVHEDKTHLYTSSHQTAVWSQQDSCSELQSMYLYTYDRSRHYLLRTFLANKTKLKFAHGYCSGNEKHHVIQGTDPWTLLFNHI